MQEHLSHMKTQFLWHTFLINSTVNASVQCNAKVNRCAHTHAHIEKRVWMWPSIAIDRNKHALSGSTLDSWISSCLCFSFRLRSTSINTNTPDSSKTGCSSIHLKLSNQLVFQCNCTEFLNLSSKFDTCLATTGTHLDYRASHTDMLCHKTSCFWNVPIGCCYNNCRWYFLIQHLFRSFVAAAFISSVDYNYSKSTESCEP